MKSFKWIISIASAVIAVSAAICAVVIFQEEIARFWGERLRRYPGKAACSGSDEYADFADV